MTAVNAASGVVVIDEPRARFRDLVAAEWIKLRSLRSTAWALALSALVVVAFNVGQAYDDYRGWTGEDPRASGFVPVGALHDAFTQPAAMCLVFAAAAVGAVAIAGEYGTGMIRTTFTAVPARRPVMAAKAVVVTAVTAAFGAGVAGASFGLTQAILSGRDAGMSITEPGAFRLVAASALLAPVCALVGMAVGAIVRHAAPTLVAVFVVLLVLPAAFGIDGHWSAVVAHALPLNAWERLGQAVQDAVPYPWTTTGAWTVYAVWALAAAALTVAGVERRDQ
ncbi:ABC transporter permease subunit [Actinomadura rugatobispora]|uniref:ABC transporter permease subunit n=1 Tax=Actinomadura rugatobispora TaxID=1994 RepID=A0ABW1A7K7_9ACTN|nr:ABC transporter permease subunit [Actinomadura rugatobispora]